jgi:hypothetical protein
MRAFPKSVILFTLLLSTPLFACGEVTYSKLVAFTSYLAFLLVLAFRLLPIFELLSYRGSLFVILLTAMLVASIVYGAATVVWLLIVFLNAFPTC